MLLLFCSAKAIAGMLDHVLYAICATAAEQRSWEALPPKLCMRTWLIEAQTHSYLSPLLILKSDKSHLGAGKCAW